MREKPSALNDMRDPRFYAMGEAAKDPEARMRVIQKGMARHLELNPEQAQNFCEHGAYVGAHGVMAQASCPYCKEKGTSILFNDRREE